MLLLIAYLDNSRAVVWIVPKLICLVSHRGLRFVQQAEPRLEQNHYMLRWWPRCIVEEECSSVLRQALPSASASPLYMWPCWLEVGTGWRTTHWNQWGGMEKSWKCWLMGDRNDPGFVCNWNQSRCVQQLDRGLVLSLSQLREFIQNRASATNRDDANSDGNMDMTWDCESFTLSHREP